MTGTALTQIPHTFEAEITGASISQMVKYRKVGKHSSRVKTGYGLPKFILILKQQKALCLGIYVLKNNYIRARINL